MPVPGKLPDLLEKGVANLVNQMLLEEQSMDEQRTFRRVPFCRPVTVTITNGDRHGSSRQWSALTRDISETGVGLLSRVPMEKGTS